MNETGGNEQGNLFLQMVFTLQTSAWHHLGKVASPFTGKIERDLLSAKAAIDMLIMLKEKTEGNLHEAEKKVLDHVIYELQMNYVDESNKPEEPEAKEEEKPEGEESDVDAAAPKTEPTSESDTQAKETKKNRKKAKKKDTS